MSDYGIQPSEFKTLTENAYATMGGLFEVDPQPMTQADVMQILEKSYR